MDSEMINKFSQKKKLSDVKFDHSLDNITE